MWFSVKFTANFYDFFNTDKLLTVYFKIINKINIKKVCSDESTKAYMELSLHSGIGVSGHHRNL